jgi:hypothetical protein
MVVRVAYHFNADLHGGYYGPPIYELLFRAVLSKVPAARRHVRIKTGDLLLHSYGAKTYDDVEARARALLQPERPVWSTLDTEVFPVLAHSTNICVLDLTGLTIRDARAVDEELKRIDSKDSYFGALQIDLAVDLHWAMYDQSLVDKFRITGNELRLLHEAEEWEGDRDVAMLEQWRESGLFESVQFEDIGVQGSIFDPYDTREHAQRVAELDELLGAQFGVVANETLLRTGDLDPRLHDVLHAALKTFDRAQTSEELAQAALSSRRFLERLADALFPPQKEPRNGRSLTKREYRNRLWAYVEGTLSESNRDLVLASLDDVGRRIDELVEFANRGLHADAVSAGELQRLLVALVTLAYDLLTLEPPARKVPYGPYEAHVEQTLSDWIKRGKE